jgi:hypothetical protein
MMGEGTSELGMRLALNLAVCWLILTIFYWGLLLLLQLIAAFWFVWDLGWLAQQLALGLCCILVTSQQLWCCDLVWSFWRRHGNFACFRISWLGSFLLPQLVTSFRCSWNMGWITRHGCRLCRLSAALQRNWFGVLVWNFWHRPWDVVIWWRSCIPLLCLTAVANSFCPGARPSDPSSLSGSFRFLLTHVANLDMVILMAWCTVTGLILSIHVAFCFH